MSPHLPALLALTLLAAVTFPATADVANDTACRRSCGNISVPYPFGIDAGCFRSGFDLTCDDTTEPATLSLNDTRILSLDHQNGSLRVHIPIARQCYGADGVRRSTTKTNMTTKDLSNTPFSFSVSRNRVTATGCDTLMMFSDLETEFMAGCISWCKNTTVIPNNTCSGIGCCETNIPTGLKSFLVLPWSIYNHTQVWEFNPCSYAFLVEVGAFKFDKTFISTDYNYKEINFPVILDWSIQFQGHQTCEKARKDISSYACKSTNSICFGSNDGLGYLCNCSRGYEGNPYENNGCRDIIECDKPTLYPCQGLCQNTIGSYECTCPIGTFSEDPKIKNCTSITSKNQNLKLVIGIGGGVILFLVLAFIVYSKIQTRKLAKMKEKLFQQNGGFHLQELISSDQTTSLKIFSTTDMERATNNYSDDRILGRGGHGIVYKGILDDNSVVAIKKSMIMGENETKEFAKEMIILSQLNHINIVKLLGCCLEVEVPMLIYEYIPNGTLFHYIHVRRLEFVIPLSTRLRIAMETVEALAYLHSAASPPILHGDVKSSNILLDRDYVAKVSDFGTSILAPNDKTQFTTLVQGTCGYLDPEYLLTCKLTEKSDIYSFGVVLLELLTGKKALSFGGLEEDKSLVQMFFTFKKQNKLLDILDSQIIGEGLTKQLLDVSQLAMQCLNLRGDERPTSKEVVRDLEAIIKTVTHPWVKRRPEEAESLLGDGSKSQSSEVTGYLSMEIRLTDNISSAGR